MKFRQLAFAFALFSSASLFAQSAETIVLNGAENGPLVVLDGVEISQEELAELASDEIGEISILKGEKATEKYGEKGANGVIVVTSKVNTIEQVLISDGIPAEKAKPSADEEVKMQLPADFEGLVLIDGKEATLEELRSLPPDSIDQIQVHKAADAIDLFGERGKAGVIVVVTKS